MQSVAILAAFDKFKDSIDADGIASALLNSLRKRCPTKIGSTETLSLSDGGEGFLQALRRAHKLQTCPIAVTGPLGEVINAELGYNVDRHIAIIESSMACGLQIVPPALRNPLKTTSYGVGQMIQLQRAVELGAKHIIIGIGGSSTNDGGLGALQALGLEILCVNPLDNSTYEPIPFTGEHLQYITSLRYRRTPILEGVRVEVACDVNNPFIGTNGAVAIFSPQKGSTPESRVILESGMLTLSHHLHALTGIDVSMMPGAGAAGGIGGGFHAVLGAELKPGVELLGEAVGLEESIQRADLVFTGEGCYDAQTASGKVVSLVQRLAAKHHKPCVVICGINKTAERTNVYSLMEACGNDTELSMTQPALVVDILVRRVEFPLLGSR